MGDDAATPPGLFDRIRSMIQDEVGKLLRSGLLRNASISDGGLTIKGGFLRLRAPGATSDTLYVGALDPVKADGTQQPGFVLYREDGTVAMRLWDNSPLAGYAQFLAIYDRAGNVILGDDTDSGQGIARPYVPASFYRARYNDWGVSTTSATFETLWRGEIRKQHPQLSVATLSSMDTSATTGELRVLVDGVQLGATASIGFVQTTSLFGPAPIAGVHMKNTSVEIQGRRTSGTGALRVEPLHMQGRQT